MEENNKPEVEEPQPPAPGDPPEETVGDIMKKSGSDAVKFWVIVASIIVYLAGIIYAEIHGLTMLQKGVAPDMRIWAQLGMIAAGITAVALPVALKVWTIEARQRIWAYAFYVLDFVFLAFNAFTDFNTQTGQTLAPWAQTYVTYVLPSSPVVIAACWALVWELDPAIREKITLLTLRAAMKKKMADRVAEAAKGARVTDAVNKAASHEVDRALWELFGARPADGYYVMDEPKPGILKSFFGYLSSRARQALSSAMAGQSQDSASDEPKNPPQP